MHNGLSTFHENNNTIMSDKLNHECGIAFLRLKKPLEYYKEKYGSAFYGIQKMYLLMEKQHNRGQDGAGFASIKFDMEAGERYISRIRSNDAQPIQDIFAQINGRINEEMQSHPEYAENVALQKKNIPTSANCFLDMCVTERLARTALKAFTRFCARIIGCTGI